MFHNATAIYAYGFESHHAQRVLAHVRGSVYRANLELRLTDQYHSDGVMLVSEEAAQDFLKLIRSLGIAPRNVLLYPALPRDARWDNPSFGGIFDRRIGSPFTEFQRLLEEIDAELGAVKKS